MKKALLVTASIALLGNAHAQDNPADAMTIAVGGSFAKPKIIPKLEKLGVAQLTVSYKQTTTKAVVKNEKKFNGIGKTNVASGTAVLTAYLETTDGELTEQDYQEITDHGYSYLQKKLKEAGIDTVAWNTITGTDFYKAGKEATDEDLEEEKAKGQTWVTYSANKGNSMYGGKTAFAFGKIKKASNFCEEIGAPAAFFHTTVDFVEILIDLDVKTHRDNSYFHPKDITVYKSKTQAGPLMKVPANSGNSLFWNERSQAETVIVTEDIPAGVGYQSELSEDADRAKKSKWFSISLSKKLESVPVVISTTRGEYKMAAKKALERYADTFIAKAKEVKKA